MVIHETNLLQHAIYWVILYYHASYVVSVYTKLVAVSHYVDENYIEQ